MPKKLWKLCCSGELTGELKSVIRKSYLRHNRKYSWLDNSFSFTSSEKRANFFLSLMEVLFSILHMKTDVIICWQKSIQSCYISLLISCTLSFSKIIANGKHMMFFTPLPVQTILCQCKLLRISKENLLFPKVTVCDFADKHGLQAPSWLSGLRKLSDLVQFSGKYGKI